MAMYYNKVKYQLMADLSTLGRTVRIAALSLGVPLAALALQAPSSLFVERVYPALERAECRSCHNSNGVASGTRLRFPPSDADRATAEAFGLGLSSLIDRQDPKSSLLLRKPTLQMPHAGGERIRKGSSEEASLREWVNHLASVPEADLRASIARLGGSRTKSGQPTALRRLTHAQYNNTVRDLLGDFTRPADHFPQEDYLNGFTNQVEGQTVPPLLAEAYTTAAEKLAANAFRHGEATRVIPCKPKTANDAVCRDRFIRDFGGRAFRRPLTGGEVRKYAALFDETDLGKLDFNGRAKLVVEAMLQSPAFLFHLEEGPAGRWRQYGVASRLSYFLWDTMPDEQLFQAAQAGELKDAAGVKRVAAAMMKRPEAKRALENFLAQWLRFDRVLASARNVRRYPDFGPSLLSAMTQETRHLFNHLVWNDKNFMEFFKGDYTFVSARLAQLYGLEAPAQDFDLVKYPAASKRAGVLGHAGFLTLTGNPNETSPTARGLFVREHFLCQVVPPPPPGVDTTLPALDGEKPMTTRERLALHTTNKSCSGCHNLIDPIGSGLEGFDNIGRGRDKVVVTLQQQRDAVTNATRQPQRFELPLDTSGFIQGIAESNFSTAAQLGNILAESPVCQTCMVKQIFRYAVGRHETDADERDLNELYKLFKTSGFRFQSLLLALVSSGSFLGEEGPDGRSVTSTKLIGSRKGNSQ
jgi:hypothetical protein